MSIQLAVYASYAVIALTALTIVMRKGSDTIDPLWFTGEIGLTALMCYAVSLADEARTELMGAIGLVIMTLASVTLVLKHVTQPGKTTS